MRWPFRTRGTVLAPLFAVSVVPGGVAGWFYVRSVSNSGMNVMPSSNAILVIAPYWHAGTWVFDDDRVGLEKEPFVAGVPEMIDILVTDIPDAKQGFRLLFSPRPFPGYQKKLTWLRGNMGGNDYALEDPPMEGWLCPALFKYFEEPPPEIYVKAEPLKR